MIKKLKISETRYRTARGVGKNTIPKGLSIVNSSETNWYDEYEFDRDLTQDELRKYGFQEINEYDYVVFKISGQYLDDALDYAVELMIYDKLDNTAEYFTDENIAYRYFNVERKKLKENEVLILGTRVYNGLSAWRIVEYAN